MVYYKVLTPKKEFFVGFNIDEYIRACKVVEKDNEAKFSETNAKYLRAKDLIKDVYGFLSKEYKYIKRNPPKRPVGLKRVIAKTRKNYYNHMKKLDTKKKAKIRKERSKRMVEFLIDRGLTPDEDFPVRSVISWGKSNVLEIGGELYLTKDTKEV